jgi:hypothetical protein
MHVVLPACSTVAAVHAEAAPTLLRWPGITMSSLQPSPSLSYVQLRRPALASSSCRPNRLAAGAPASASSTNVARLLLLGPRQHRKSDAVSAGRKQQVGCTCPTLSAHYSILCWQHILLLNARHTVRHALHLTSLPCKAAFPDSPCQCTDARLLLSWLGAAILLLCGSAAAMDGPGLATTCPIQQEIAHSQCCRSAR